VVIRIREDAEKETTVPTTAAAAAAAPGNRSRTCPGATLPNSYTIQGNQWVNKELTDLEGAAKTKKASDLLIEECRKDNCNVYRVKALLDSGADLNAGDCHGNTVLMWEAWNGHTEIIKVLCESGADVNAENDYGITALMRVSLNGHTEIIKVLCEAGADLNASDKYGNTALKRAAFKGHTEVVKLLIANGADLEAVKKEGRTALMWADSMGRTGIAALLQAVKDNEMKPLNEIPESDVRVADLAFRDFMEIRRNSTNWIAVAILNGQTLDSLQHLIPGLEKKLNDPNYKKKIVRIVLERMPKDEKDRLPTNFVSESDLDNKYKIVINSRLLTRKELSIFRVTHNTGIPNQNPTLEELVQFIKEQRAAAAATKI